MFHANQRTNVVRQAHEHPSQEVSPGGNAPGPLAGWDAPAAPTGTRRKECPRFLHPAHPQTSNVRGEAAPFRVAQDGAVPVVTVVLMVAVAAAMAGAVWLVMHEVSQGSAELTECPDEHEENETTEQPPGWPECLAGGEP